MLRMGYVHGLGRRGLRCSGLVFPRLSGEECENPLAMQCEYCHRWERWACKNHRESKCRPCARRYRRRVQRVAESGLGRPGGYEYLLTVSAPGDGLHCKHPRCHVKGGGCGHELCACTPAEGTNLAVWNAGHSRRWNLFRTRLKQSYPALQYHRAVEVQDGKRGGSARGALHDHALVWSPEPLQRKEIRRLAIECGFGHECDLAVIRSSKQAAYYVSKYVSKATDSRGIVPWTSGEEIVDGLTGEITQEQVVARYRTWSQSREWGLTMKAVRAEVAAAAKARALALHQVQVQMLSTMLGAQVADEPAPDT